MSTINREAARAAGYSDAEIDDFERKTGGSASVAATQPQPQTQVQAAPGMATMVKQPGKPLTASEVATGAIFNFPSSIGKMAGEVYTALTNPVETIKGVLDIGAGTLQSLLPNKIVDFVGRDQESIDKANLVKKFYKDRYGSIEGAKEALATDPASVLSDMSLFLTGGAAIAPKAAGISGALSTAAKVTDPLRIALAPLTYGSKAIAPILGQTTGAGSAAIEEAFKAGKEGGAKGTSFVENLRGTADQLQVVQDTKANLDALIKQQQADYRVNMAGVSADKSILKFDDIEQALKDASDRVTYKGKVTNKSGMERIQEAQQIIDDWKKSNPGDFHTPEGLDKLKQSIYDEVISKIPLEQKNTFTAVNNIYKSIKSTIEKQAPTYAQTMKQYAEAADLTNEIERTLSLSGRGKKASIDTQLRKLQTVLRDNAATGYGQRVKLVEQLEASPSSMGGGIPLRPQLAGQALSKITPRGIQAAGTVGTAGLLSQVSSPMALAYLAASSPRLAGEASYLAGRGAKQAGMLGGLLPEVDYSTMFNLLSKAQTEQ